MHTGNTRRWIAEHRAIAWTFDDHTGLVCKPLYPRNVEHPARQTFSDNIERCPLASKTVKPTALRTYVYEHTTAVLHSASSHIGAPTHETTRPCWLVTHL